MKISEHPGLVGGRSSSWVVAEVGVTLSTRVIRSKSAAAAADVQRRAADDELSCTHSDLIYRVIRVIAFEIYASLRALAPYTVPAYTRCSENKPSAISQPRSLPTVWLNRVDTNLRVPHSVVSFFPVLYRHVSCRILVEA